MNVLPSLDSLYLGLDWIFIYIPSKSSILTQKIPLQGACLLCFFMCLLSSDCLPEMKHINTGCICVTRWLMYQTDAAEIHF